MQSDRENIEPNKSPELMDLIRENIEYQENQNIKNTLYKQSLVKISLDKDFEHLFDRDNHSEVPESEANCNLIEVTSEIKQICSWLEDSEEFKGMAYLPYSNLPKLLHILHQKVENTVIVVTEYHSMWMERMDDLARLHKIKWGFLNCQQTKEQKIQVLELYEMKKIKLLFISPSIFKFDQYMDFCCDLLVLPDLHLYLQSQQFVSTIVDKCTPGRFLALYSTLLRQTYAKSSIAMPAINDSKIDNSVFISLKTQNDEKFKTLLSYIQKSQAKRTLLIVKDKNQAASISKMLKLKSVTSLNMFQCLSPQEMNSFTCPDILGRDNNLEQKVLDVVYKSRNYQITISKYFDALRFANYDCVVLYSFVDVPHFVGCCPDTNHRVTLLCEDDYYKLRNEITSENITVENLTKIVMKIMEKIRKKEVTNTRRFYSDYVDDKLMDFYSVSKQFAQKNQEKVIRISWFCKTYDISLRSFKRVINGLSKIGVILKDCKLVYEIEIEEQSLPKFRKLFPDTVEVRRKVNILNLSSTAMKTTRAILQQLKNHSVNYKVTQKALKLKIVRNYEQIDWLELEKAVNREVTEGAADLDKSYVVYKQCSYGSVELTRRQKCLQRKKQILNFYSYAQDKHSNVLESSHRCNLLTSQIEQWIRHSSESNLDEHELILLLQGIDVPKTSRFKQDPIFGRYRRYRYEDLGQVVQRIYKNKRIKR